MSIEKNINTRIQHKHDTEANWEKATNFIPKQGELIVYDKEKNSSGKVVKLERFKMGDGSTTINNLPFIGNSYVFSVTNSSAAGVTMDKTFEDLEAAHQAGMVICCKYSSTIGTYMLDFVSRETSPANWSFSTLVGASLSIGVNILDSNGKLAVTEEYKFLTDNEGTITGVSIDGTSIATSGVANIRNATLGQGYGTCSTGKSVSNKTVTLTNYALVTGGVVVIKFTNGVNASATLNINGKGAKSIYYNGTRIGNGVIKAGDVVIFIYDGNVYHLIAIDNNIIGRRGSGFSSVMLNSASEASGLNSLAEGYLAKATGSGSHAEGYNTTASGDQSHAEGFTTIASGPSSHVEGTGTTASGQASHAEGNGTIAASDAQHVQGKYNIEDTEDKYAHIVGNGTNVNARSNAHTVDWDGNAWFSGNIKVGGTGQDDENACELARADVVAYIDESNETVDDVIVNGGASIDVTAEVGQTIIVEEVDASGKPTKWKAADYQPRTHWSEFADTVLIDNQSYGEYDEVFLDFALVAGQSYHIVFNGVEYDEVARSGNADGMVYVALGDGAMLGEESTGEPYTFVYVEGHGTMPATNGGGDYTISLSTVQEIVHKMPDKYIPDEVVAYAPYYVNVFKSVDDADNPAWRTLTTVAQLEAMIDAGRMVIAKVASSNFGTYYLQFCNDNTTADGKRRIGFMGGEAALQLVPQDNGTYIGETGIV